MQQRAFISLILLLAILPQAALGQATTARVEGTVTDPGGQPVQDATVIVTNTRTALARATVTDDFGRYSVQGLPPAPYQVEVQAAELFAAPVETVLQIGRSTTLNVQMSVQQVEVITVTSERAVFDVSKPEVSTVVSERQIEELPLINRDFTDLASLAPGAKPKQTGQLDPTKNEDIYRPFTIGAGNGREVNIQIDGGDTNDRAVGTWTQGLHRRSDPGVRGDHRSIQGRVWSRLPRRGQRDHQDRLQRAPRLGLRSLPRRQHAQRGTFSERLSGTEKSPSERRQWGGSLGGRLVADKLFFFTAYEHVEEESPTAYSPDLTGYARTAGVRRPELFDRPRPGPVHRQAQLEHQQQQHGVPPLRDGRQLVRERSGRGADPQRIQRLEHQRRLLAARQLDGTLSGNLLERADRCTPMISRTASSAIRRPPRR